MPHTKKILASIIILLFIGVCYTYADRGLRKKAKNNVVLNIKTAPTFQSALGYNLKTGLKYTGMTNYNSFRQGAQKNEYINRTINSYRKGNTIYIVPKYKNVSAESKNGFSGIKLTLNLH
jgi:hypothetical protein